MKGGGPLSLFLLLEGLDKSIFHPVVVCPRIGIFTKKLSESNIDWVISPLLSFSIGKTISVIDFFKMWIKYFLGTIKILYLIKKYRVDIVHTNTIFPFAGAITAWFWNVPHIWHVREILSSPFYHFILKRLTIKKIINKLSVKIICISDIVKKDIVLNQYIEPSKTIVVYNAVKTENISNPGKKHLNNRIVIGTVGSIRPLKQQHIIPELLKNIMIKDRELLFEWHIYGKISGGSEKYYDGILRKIKEQGLEENCIIKGFCEQTDIYSSIDILVHTAKDEAFGRVFIEAMAAGIPVVAFDSGAVNEIIINNETGYIIKENNWNFLCDILCKLMKNKNLRDEMGLRAKEDVYNRFSSYSHVNKVVNIYNSILSQNNVLIP